MGIIFKHIAVEQDDFKKFKTVVRDELFRVWPEYSEMKISDAFLFKKVIEYWLEK